MLFPVDLLAKPKPVPNPVDDVVAVPKPPNTLLPVVLVVLPKLPNRPPEGTVEPDPKEPNPNCKK